MPLTMARYSLRQLLSGFFPPAPLQLRRWCHCCRTRCCAWRRRRRLRRPAFCPGACSCTACCAVRWTEWALSLCRLMQLLPRLVLVLVLRRLHLHLPRLLQLRLHPEARPAPAHRLLVQPKPARQLPLSLLQPILHCLLHRRLKRRQHRCLLHSLHCSPTFVLPLTPVNVACGFLLPFGTCYCPTRRCGNQTLRPLTRAGQSSSCAAFGTTAVLATLTPPLPLSRKCCRKRPRASLRLSGHSPGERAAGGAFCCTPHQALKSALFCWTQHWLPAPLPRLLAQLARLVQLCQRLRLPPLVNLRLVHQRMAGYQRSLPATSAPLQPLKRRVFDLFCVRFSRICSPLRSRCCAWSMLMHVCGTRPWCSKRMQRLHLLALQATSLARRLWRWRAATVVRPCFSWHQSSPLPSHHYTHRLLLRPRRPTLTLRCCRSRCMLLCCERCGLTARLRAARKRFCCCTHWKLAAPTRCCTLRPAGRQPPLAELWTGLTPLPWRQLMQLVLTCERYCLRRLCCAPLGSCSTGALCLSLWLYLLRSTQQQRLQHCLLALLHPQAQPGPLVRRRMPARLQLPMRRNPALLPKALQHRLLPLAAKALLRLLQQRLPRCLLRQSLPRKLTMRMQAPPLCRQASRRLRC